VLAALVVATIAADHTMGTEHSPLAPPGLWRTAWTSALITAFVLYLIGLFLVRGGRGRVLMFATVAIAIQFAPLAGPLLLSTDVYSYWDYGRIAAVHDANPYEVRPSRFPDDPAYSLMGADWQEKRTVYGPAFTLVSEGHAQVAGESAERAARLYRLLAALAMAVVVALIAFTTRSNASTVFVGWNPLLPLHFAGGGHNDALMAALLIAGLTFAALGRPNAEGAAWALAAAVKVVPLVLLPLRLLEARAQRRAFGYWGLALGTAAIAAVAVARYGLGWLTIFTPVANQLQRSSSLGLPYWFAKVGIPETVARDGLIVSFVIAYVWLLIRAARGRRELALTASLLLVATAWLHPWYAVWAVPLAAIEDDWRARTLVIALSAYFLRDALPL
jgi:hypothetical protein